ncbi:MAG: hypothetical protein GX927_08305 [Lentisphaerae bacterium]|jgi:putative aminopeptidase FrvX|nr:hypothetical protein [Lentisphaerota bacterium]
MNIDLLKRLVHCHSTPGEEDEVIDLLAQEWSSHAGWQCQALGRYAFLAGQSAARKPSRGRILICAHADSPGYIVDSLKDGYATVVPLGLPKFKDSQIRAVVKTRNDKIPVILQKVSEGDSPEIFRFREHPGVRRGDRVAYAADFVLSHDNAFLSAPFLDNRAGCYLLCELVASLPAVTPCQVFVGVTSAEEFTGFGASVLARHLDADLVICLDTTYASEAQDVALQNGPVLTLSDKSVLVSSKVEGALHEYCQKWGVPLQTEVYNFSGTDAKAFPMAGSLAPVLPLLIPSDGNHSPLETIAVRDLEQTLFLLQKLCLDKEALPLLKKAFTWSFRA